jgi:hypothetical protein
MKGEKERAGMGTIPAYVYRVDRSTNEHKQAGLRGGRGALCSSTTRRTQVTLIKNPTNGCLFPVVSRRRLRCPSRH